MLVLGFRNQRLAGDQCVDPITGRCIKCGPSDCDDLSVACRIPCVRGMDAECERDQAEKMAQKTEGMHAGLGAFVVL